MKTNNKQNKTDQEGTVLNRYASKVDSRGRVLIKGNKLMPYYEVVENADGSFTLIPMELKRKRRSLDELLASMKPEDTFDEMDTGKNVGLEVLD